MPVGLSIRQPWVELILLGRKTIEVRTWSTLYRGRLWLHAGRRIEMGACTDNGITRSELVVGAIVGHAELFDVFEFDPTTWRQTQNRHLNRQTFDQQYFGWVLRHPRRIEPKAFRGRLGLMRLDPPGVFSELQQ